MMKAGGERLATEPIARHESMKAKRPNDPTLPVSGVSGTSPVNECAVTAEGRALGSQLSDLYAVHLVPTSDMAAQSLETPFQAAAGSRSVKAVSGFARMCLEAGIASHLTAKEFIELTHGSVAQSQTVARVPESQS